MPKLDGMTYPDNSQAMLKDTLIGPMYRAYLDKALCGWIHVYIDDAMKKRDPKSQFKKFFAKGANQAVNIDGDTLANARRLAAAKDWKNTGWKDVYDLADYWVKRVATDREDLFYKAETFKAHHVAMLEKKILRTKYPALLAELDTVDKKGVAAAAMLKADKKKGPRTVKAFAKKNKLKMKPNDVIKKFKKAFKIA